jgi:16S rRNA (adenine1518-N6/adenine1519-N6)-dimethyltransferase
MNLYSAKEMTALLEKHDFFFKKNLGQNFLMNESTANRIACASRETLPEKGPTMAIEIGPGAGSLTLQLSRLFDRVLAIEIDPHLIGVLEESLSECENVEIQNMDALQFDFSALAKAYPEYSFAVCSNLPYYITSEIIMRLLESEISLASITVLIQKEAALRLTSKPAEENFGAITASVSYYAKAEKLFLVGPGNFIPRPKVDSAVLRLLPHQEPPVAVQDRETFFRIIRAAFLNRRKTLSNALFSAFQADFTKDQILHILEKAGIDPQRRGETLSLSEFASISDNFTKYEE